jgi:uncharacterized membrane protein (DUF2068 family)
MQRPVGITVLAIVLGLRGGLSLAMACGAIAVGRWLTRQSDSFGPVPLVLSSDLAFRGTLLFLLGVIGTFASLLKLISGAGLLMLQPWAWWLALISATIKLLTHLVTAVRGAITPMGIAAMVVDIGVLAYLAGPQVRRALEVDPVESIRTHL